jgi:branched-chain amino acid transport system ATP-binding protein
MAGGTERPDSASAVCGAPSVELRAPALEMHKVVGGYGDATVLWDVSISVPARSVVALLGANGAGKSTVMRMASGLLRPESGRILLSGRDVTRLSPSRRANLGMCHIVEGRGIFPSLTVRDNLLVQAPRRTPESVILERTKEVFPPLVGRRRQLAGTLSGGEQQMLALMRAYLANPSLVLVDEASLGLAPLAVDAIYGFLERIATEGVSLLIVEQYVSRALAMADTVYVMSQGQVVFSGRADELSQSEIFTLYSSGERLAP